MINAPAKTCGLYMDVLMGCTSEMPTERRACYLKWWETAKRLIALHQKRWKWSGVQSVSSATSRGGVWWIWAGRRELECFPLQRECEPSTSASDFFHCSYLPVFYIISSSSYLTLATFCLILLVIFKRARKVLWTLSSQMTMWSFRATFINFMFF